VRKPRLRTIIILIILPFLIFGAWSIVIDGHFQPWQNLPTPPAHFSEIFASGGATVCAKTGNGETYRCTDLIGQCWVRDKITEWCINQGGVPSSVNMPCDFSLPEFSFLTNSPKNIVDCIQSIAWDADATERHTYTLQQDGTVSEWSHVINNILRCLVCLFIVGLIALAAIVFRVMTRHRKKNVGKDAM
jgi:hypothetical protein